jgi:hypothetical protein
MSDVGLVDHTHVKWRAIIFGAVIAAGVSFTLLAFGAAIGLSVTSTAPTWRDSSPWLWILSGIFLIFVALCAFAFGGYATGRMTTRRTIATDEAEFVDGMHGIGTWALSILLTAILALGAAATIVPAAVPGSGPAGPASSVAGENIIASELDGLFRSDKRTIDVAALNYRRSEASRILLKSSSHNGVSGEDADALTANVSAATGLGVDESRTRVAQAISSSAQEIRRARQAAVMQAFLVAAALLVGAAVAWFSACEGGRDRDANQFLRWDWTVRRRQTRSWKGPGSP